MSSASDKTSTGREAAFDGAAPAAERPARQGAYPTHTLPLRSLSGRPERDAAYDAVYAIIAAVGDEMPDAPVNRNALIWRAVSDALDAYDEATVRDRHRRIDALTRAAYEDGRGDGRVEGRRQATEDWEREWGAWWTGEGTAPELVVTDVFVCRDEADARSVAARSQGRRTVVSRLVGPWEPTEPTEQAGVPDLAAEDRCARSGCGHPRKWHNARTTLGVYPCVGDVASCACTEFAEQAGDTQ